MKRGFWGLLLLLGPVGAAEAAPPAFAPAKNWVLPLFTKEGYRSMTLNGDEVHPVSLARIAVVNILLTTYSGDAAARGDTILISPAASYFPREHRAGGPAGVRVIRDDGEIAGEDWTYEQEGKKISIRRQVRAVFKEKLGNLLR